MSELKINHWRYRRLNMKQFAVDLTENSTESVLQTICRGSDRELNGKRAPHKKIILQDNWIRLWYIIRFSKYNSANVKFTLNKKIYMIYVSIIQLSGRINFLFGARFPFNSRSDPRQNITNLISPTDKLFNRHYYKSIFNGFWVGHSEEKSKTLAMLLAFAVHWTFAQ